MPNGWLAGTRASSRNNQTYSDWFRFNEMTSPLAIWDIRKHNPCICQQLWKSQWLLEESGYFFVTDWWRPKQVCGDWLNLRTKLQLAVRKKTGWKCCYFQQIKKIVHICHWINHLELDLLLWKIQQRQIHWINHALNL